MVHRLSGDRMWCRPSPAWRGPRLSRMAGVVRAMPGMSWLARRDVQRAKGCRLRGNRMTIVRRTSIGLDGPMGRAIRWLGGSRSLFRRMGRMSPIVLGARMFPG